MNWGDWRGLLGLLARRGSSPSVARDEPAGVPGARSTSPDAEVTAGETAAPAAAYGDPLARSGSRDGAEAAGVLSPTIILGPPDAHRAGPSAVERPDGETARDNADLAAMAAPPMPGVNGSPAVPEHGDGALADDRQRADAPPEDGGAPVGSNGDGAGEEETGLADPEWARGDDGGEPLGRGSRWDLAEPDWARGSADGTHEGVSGEEKDVPPHTGAAAETIVASRAPDGAIEEDHAGSMPDSERLVRAASVLAGDDADDAGLIDQAPEVTIDLRAVLARKLAAMWPTLQDDDRSELRALTLRAIEKLASDQILQVRKALAHTLSDIACAPPTVVRRLALDVERAVAEPILQNCMALREEDLLEIVSDDPESWRLAAIARRQHVSGPVSDAIVDSGDSHATGVLLDNTGAEISEETLEDLIDTAASTRRDYQMALARRPGLPSTLAARLAEFVDKTVLDVLHRHQDFDEDTNREIVDVMRRRMIVAPAQTDHGEAAYEQARELYRTGELNSTVIADAAALANEPLVTAGLALKIGIPIRIVEKILESRSPKSVTALAWRGGLDMRSAIQVQRHVAKIDPRHLLNARGGTDFPMTEDEMAWHLEFFGVPERRARLPE